MTPFRAVLSLAGVLALAVSGCGSSSPARAPRAPAPSNAVSSSAATAGPASAHATRVVISGYAFAPATVTVARGAKVTFTNRDQTNHTATANGGAFDTGTLAPGKVKTVVVTRPGTYTYLCQFHAFMKATLVVK